MDIKKDNHLEDTQRKIFTDLSEVPLLAGHRTYMVRSDAQLDANWEQLSTIQSDMNAAYHALTERILAYLRTEGLLDEVSGIAATKFNCVWLNCSIRAWAHLEEGLRLTAWSDPAISADPSNEN